MLLLLVCVILGVECFADKLHLSCVCCCCLIGLASSADLPMLLNTGAVIVQRLGPKIHIIIELLQRAWLTHTHAHTHTYTLTHIAPLSFPSVLRYPTTLSGEWITSRCGAVFERVFVLGRLEALVWRLSAGDGEVGDSNGARWRLSAPLQLYSWFRHFSPRCYHYTTPHHMPSRRAAELQRDSSQSLQREQNSIDGKLQIYGVF